MKKLLIFLLFGISDVSFARVSTAPEPPDNTSFDFRSLNVAQAVQLIYAEALKEAYVIDPEVLTDQRNVSFRYDSACSGQPIPDTMLSFSSTTAGASPWLN